MSELNLGDVVALKSGSLPMTVTSVSKEMPNGATAIECSYFDGAKIVRWKGLDLAVKKSTSSLSASDAEKLIRYRGIQNTSD